jgi:CheY-like chemotaxis protein/tetratricopeptide (TPR) repeat protein
MAAKILLVEDNEPLARSLTQFLLSQRHEVRVAGSGVQALQALAAGSPDLLILDLRLPELSGIELLQKLRKTPAGSQLPVVIMSGVFRGERYAEGARALGVGHYLEKPFTRQAFQDAVAQALADSATPLKTLADIHLNRRTGLLSLGDGSPIAFLRGEPITFQSAGRGDFLSFLRGRSRLNSGDETKWSLLGKDRLQITRAGLLTLEELMEESRAFLSRLLLDALQRKAGVRFQEGAVEFDPPFTPLSTPQFAYEGIRGTQRADAAASLRPYGTRYPARAAGYYAIANLCSFRQEDIEILSRMDGSRPLAELCPADTGVGAELFRFMMAFNMVTLHPGPAADAAPPFPLRLDFNRPLEELQTLEDSPVGFDDLVEAIGGAEPLVGEESMGSPLSREEIGLEQSLQRTLAAIQGKNYYELFDLTGQTFSFEALKSAYFQRTREYSPEKFMELSGSALALAQDILAAYADAYNTLSNVVAKERYDELLNANTVGLDGRRDERLQASVQFQSGQVFLEMGEFDNAERALLDSYTLEPENPLHSAYLAWAIYRNPGNASSRNARERSRSLLAKSLQHEKTAEAFAFRGWMLLDEGRDGLAEGEFQKALKIQPRNSLARKGLSQIVDRREAEKKGIFRKIFG